MSIRPFMLFLMDYHSMEMKNENNLALLSVQCASSN